MIKFFKKLWNITKSVNNLDLIVKTTCKELVLEIMEEPPYDHYDKYFNRVSAVRKEMKIELIKSAVLEFNKKCGNHILSNLENNEPLIYRIEEIVAKKAVEEYKEECKNFTNDYLDSEEFIDTIITRINNKQLNRNT